MGKFMPDIKIVDDEETGKRLPDIKILLSYLYVSDEEWADILDSAIITDESILWDFLDTTEPDAEEKAKKALQTLLPGVEINTGLYLWQLVDSIKRQMPGWPGYLCKN